MPLGEPVVLSACSRVGDWRSDSSSVFRPGLVSLIALIAAQKLGALRNQRHSVRYRDHMSVIWGIHNDQPALDFVSSGFVSIGWDLEGDIRAIGSDRDALKNHLLLTRPDAKPGAVPIWAGILYRFAYEMKIGDLIIYPNRADSTLNFGRIDNDYYWDGAAAFHRSRRKVTWLQTGVPRARFSQGARYEVGSALTLFRVKGHADEFETFVANGNLAQDVVAEAYPEALPVEQATARAEDEINATRIEDYTRDFVVDTLMTKLEGVPFEYFVSDLLRAMGYRTQVTPASGDGGFDIIAHRDLLGLEPPIIKVQCKRTLSTIGAPDVQKLTGTLAPGGSELGLFVTLGSYSKDAIGLGRTRQDLRLVSGKELVEMIFENYDKLPAERKRLLPMRSVWVIDKDPGVL